MKKGIIIVNGFSAKVNQPTQTTRLSEEFDKLGVKIAELKNIDLARIVEDKAVASLPDTDFVIYLDKDRHVSHLLEKCGYTLFNSADSIELADDKMMTYITLCNSGITMPTTFSSPLRYVDDGTDCDIIDRVEKTLGYPVIVKECYGSFGKQVYLAEDRLELEGLRKELMLKPHLYQKYIATSYGVDTRVIVIGGKVFAWMQRSNPNDFRSNLELGGVGSVCELPNSFREMSEKIAKIMRLDYCGIDLLNGANGEPIACEVNSNAFFRGVERVTGKNVAAEYAKLVYDRVYK